jgi:hypothetical protein
LKLNNKINTLAISSNDFNNNSSISFFIESFSLVLKYPILINIKHDTHLMWWISLAFAYSNKCGIISIFVKSNLRDGSARINLEFILKDKAYPVLSIPIKNSIFRIYLHCQTIKAIFLKHWQHLNPVEKKVKKFVK